MIVRFDIQVNGESKYRHYKAVISRETRGDVLASGLVPEKHVSNWTVFSWVLLRGDTYLARRTGYCCECNAITGAYVKVRRLLQKKKRK